MTRKWARRGQSVQRISEVDQNRPNVHFDQKRVSQFSHFQNGHGRVIQGSERAQTRFLHRRGIKSAIFDIQICACGSKVQNDEKCYIAPSHSDSRSRSDHLRRVESRIRLKPLWMCLARRKGKYTVKLFKSWRHVAGRFLFTFRDLCC